MNMATHFFAIRKGQEVMESIKKFCAEKNIKSAYFSVIGAAGYAEVAVYDQQEKSLTDKKFEEDLEITNLTGNVAVMDNEVVLHAHVTLTNKYMQAVGGHLKSAIISGSCEVFLTVLPEQLERKFDEETGLNTLQ